MRIVHVLGYFQPEFGYEEYYTARRQAILGHDVHVVASNMYFPFKDLGTLLEGAGAKDASRRRPVGTERCEGFTIHRLPKVMETFYDLILVGGLGELLEELRPDVVHAHEPRQGTPAMAAMHKDLGFALVIDQHGYESSYGGDGSVRDAAVRAEYDIMRRPMSNYAFARADAIIAVTEQSKRFLVEHHGVDSSRVTVLPLGVETDIFHAMPREGARLRGEMGLEDGEALMVTAGRLEPAKGIERFIRALSGLPDKKGLRWRLLIIGSGDRDYLARLKGMAAGLEPGRVEFAPFQPKERLPEYFSAADVGLWGKASITILEAMACGLPVVTTDVGGNAEVVCRDEIGSIVPFGDARALQQALDAALDKDWDRAAIIEYARANQWDKRVAQLLRAFDALLAAPTSAARPAPTAARQ